MVVYAVVDEALSPCFPLGVDLEVFVPGRMPSNSSTRYEATCPSPSAGQPQ